MEEKKNVQMHFRVTEEEKSSGEFASFSINDKVEYQVSFYNINGDRDYQTNYKLAQEYFEEVSAPYKQMFIMEDITHGLLERKSGNNL